MNTLVYPARMGFLLTGADRERLLAAADALGLPVEKATDGDGVIVTVPDAQTTYALGQATFTHPRPPETTAMTEYPTEDDLHRIAQWPYQDVAGLWAFIESIWHWPDFGVTHTLRACEAEVVHLEPGDTPVLRLATGGWSGNESIIAALKANRMVWGMTWRLSARGGLCVFVAPKQEGQ